MKKKYWGALLSVVVILSGTVFAQANPYAHAKQQSVVLSVKTPVPESVALANITAGYLVTNKCKQYASQKGAICNTQSVKIRRTRYDKKFVYFTGDYEVILDDGDVQASHGTGKVPIDPKGAGKIFRVNSRHIVRR
jgi:hypothetical protein